MVRKLNNALSYKAQEIYGELGLNDVKQFPPFVLALVRAKTHAGL